MSYLSPAIAKETVDFLLRKGKKFIEERDRLTGRQREVLQLLAEGKSMKQVAYEVESDRGHGRLS